MDAAPTPLASIHGPSFEDGGGGAGRAAATRVAQLGGGLPAPLLMVGAMLSFQLGAAVATGLFSQVGVPATAFLKNAVGGLLLVASRARTCAGRRPSSCGSRRSASSSR